ncbi:MAG TPA: SpoIIE family protein phosphatase [Spirochaetota bacterium]|nr:SpoIIE family protein phosphatase [Spirochaetota bacterium]HNU91095.1 SpoIIE family protein phosphatase [Spirochaetota bacterium]
MLYLKIVLCAFGVFTALYVLFYNVIRRFGFAVNRLFAAIALATAFMNLAILYQLLYPQSPNLLTAARVYFALVSIINQLFFHYTQIFPRWEKRSPGWFIFLSALPGTALVPFIFLWDGIMAGVVSDGIVRYEFGAYFHVYLAVFAFNILGTFFTNQYKTRALENDSFRIQLFYRSIGDHIAALVIVLSFAVMPYFLNMQEFHAVGIPLASIMLLIINNYAISDDRLIDFKRFYSRAAYWAVVFLGLALPAMLVLNYGAGGAPGGQKVPMAGLTIVLFVYFFIAYRYAAPRLAALFNRRYLGFERNVTEFFQGITMLSDLKDQSGFWDNFFNSTIDALGPRFGIGTASLYMYRENDRAYRFNYGFGEGIDIRSIDESHDLATCLKQFPGLLERSMLFTDFNLGEYRDRLLPFYGEHRIRVALPFFNHERNLIAILLLGELASGRPYPADLVSALDLYRIHFEVTLANSIYLDQIKAEQISEHDRMLVGNVKKKIIPRKMKQIDGIRISSFYLNNSEFGGDYFDSEVIRPDRLGIFIADTADAGVDSVVLGLELFTVLHTQPSTYESPERLLNIMNWVIASSRFSDHYTPAFYAIYTSTSRTLSYSNAAMRPLIFYDAARESFADLDTKGIPVGIDKNFTYESRTISVMPGSIGILHSDGLESALGASGTPYTIGRVKDIIRLNQGDTPAMLVRKIYDDFRDFTKGGLLTTDVSLIVFRCD